MRGSLVTRKFMRQIIDDQDYNCLFVIYDSNPKSTLADINYQSIL